MRGDVPKSSWLRISPIKFSPRARGCSFRLANPRGDPAVFPACAGMFLGAPRRWERLGGFPRVRGDVPGAVVDADSVILFSPRARGCSVRAQATVRESFVFPACAGMFPCLACRWFRQNRFPRVRGDVPRAFIGSDSSSSFSPRARGCSVTDDDWD